MAEFEPKIVAFLCNWCAYRGADLAGTYRIHYPPNVRVVRLMCSSTIDPVYVIEALLNGADGILIAGCHPGNCHYRDGNYKAKLRIEVLQSTLQQTGIGDRVWLRWIDASEGNLFSETIGQMVETIREKGPNPMRSPWEVWQDATVITSHTNPAVIVPDKG